MEKTGLKPIDELVRRAIIGDGAAFTELWDTNIESLKAYLAGTVMKQYDAFFIDDICSRSFEKAFRQIGSYDPSKSKFSTWFYRIVYRVAISAARQQRLFEEVPVETAEAVTPEVTAQIESLRAIYERALERQREELKAAQTAGEKESEKRVEALERSVRFLTRGVESMKQPEKFLEQLKQRAERRREPDGAKRPEEKE